MSCYFKQSVVRGTTNPAPYCHLANDTDLLTPVLWAMAGDNKQIDLLTRLPELPKIESGRPMVTLHLSWKFHANRSSRFLVMLLTKKLASHGLPELTQNVIRLSHDHSTPSPKISCKSIQPFSCNIADKETKKERKKLPENNTPTPYRGRGRGRSNQKSKSNQACIYI